MSGKTLFVIFFLCAGSNDVVEQRPPSRAKQMPRSSVSSDDGNYIETTVFLKKLDNGFGFRIVGGLEEGSQVSQTPRAETLKDLDKTKIARLKAIYSLTSEYIDRVSN